MHHIMLDLETLATDNRAVVTSIGAVAFDPLDTGANSIGEKFYVEMVDDLATQHKAGRTTHPETVVWWMRQGQAAQQLFAPDQGLPEHPRVSTVQALAMFSDFMNRHKGSQGVELWGNGADFDNMILGSLYDDMGIKRPWSYGRNRCFRTMKNMYGTPHKPERFGVHHNALDDAYTQAKHLQVIYSKLLPSSIKD